MKVPPASLIGQETSIIIVDDAKFTLEVLRRALRQGGYQDIRVAGSGQQALAMMEERETSILLADWLMPEMDGLGLTRQVRQCDEERNHYTYIILLTARDGSDSLIQAFEEGVDDFVNKSPDSKELLARIHAAGRIAMLQNDLLKANARLLELNRQNDQRNSFDLVTGLGNRAYLERQLGALLRHVDARGGSACLAVIRIDDHTGIGQRLGEKVASEVMETTATRLRQAVRPLDIVARLSDSEFAVAMHQEGNDEWHPNAFRRLHRALNLRAYKTSAGFMSVICAITVCTLNRKAAASEPDVKSILRHVRSHLDAASQSGRVKVSQWRPETSGKDGQPA